MLSLMFGTFIVFNQIQIIFKKINHGEFDQLRKKDCRIWWITEEEKII